MRRDDLGGGMPMPPDRYAELLRQKRQAPGPDPLQPVPSREPIAATTELARRLLAEASARVLESGELLLVSEEAALGDLEAAAARIRPADRLPEPPDEAPLRDLLGAGRLLCPRIWDIFGWQPPLAEHLRLMADLLRGGSVLPQVMLVGHLETFPERVEHLLRLRALAAEAPPGAVVVAVRLATPADLAAAGCGDPSPRAAKLAAILRGARPRVPATDRRHALAVARLALGPAAVVAD